ncbi:hypothetical protein F5144DRAFT_236932 [Chaetomium tenue]|uniref:Uncharacterized protein n=1 Tax=Chaetomium tenue TaxID=1854479 RepID=A0ACB7PAV2_9PEZI|nr:hypothetical protein F5144DRAFT_236932 [Chaetomium globosum]
MQDRVGTASASNTLSFSDPAQHTILFAIAFSLSRPSTGIHISICLDATQKRTVKPGKSNRLSSVVVIEWGGEQGVLGMRLRAITSHLYRHLAGDHLGKSGAGVVLVGETRQPVWLATGVPWSERASPATCCKSKQIYCSGPLPHIVGVATGQVRGPSAADKRRTRGQGVVSLLLWWRFWRGKHRRGGFGRSVVDTHNCLKGRIESRSVVVQRASC